MEKQKLGHAAAAEKLASMLIADKRKASIWRKKDGETRIYTQHGYLRISPDSETGFQYFTKSYEISEIKPIVEAWKELVEVTDDRVPERILMQEDEDGIIAPLGQHEEGVHIVREWYVER